MLEKIILKTTKPSLAVKPFMMKLNGSFEQIKNISTPHVHLVLAVNGDLPWNP